MPKMSHPTLRRWRSLLLAALAASALFPDGAWALSPSGTPENKAELIAIDKMKQDFPGYKVTVNDVQMRSNKLSITIPTVNPKGNKVGFHADVRRVNDRNGGYHYEVNNPTFN